jgi:hypothetical protein
VEALRWGDPEEVVAQLRDLCTFVHQASLKQFRLASIEEQRT